MFVFNRFEDFNYYYFLSLLWKFFYLDRLSFFWSLEFYLYNYIKVLIFYFILYS